jgi:hypothetical protein
MEAETVGNVTVCVTRDTPSEASRVSFETSFYSKQPILEPKLVSALSETKCLFRLFRFYSETESFDVSIEPKQTEDQSKQFDREHILISFTKNLGFFRFFSFFFLVFSVFSVFFGLFRNSLFRLFRFYTETESFDLSIEQKQAEDPPKQFKREYVLYKRYVQLSHLIPVTTHILNVIYTCVSVHKILHNVHIMSQSM